MEGCCGAGNKQGKKEVRRAPLSVSDAKRQTLGLSRNYLGMYPDLGTGLGWKT